MVLEIKETVIQNTPQTKLTSLLICAYRSLSIETFTSVVSLLGTGTWRYNVCYGDALISRARSVIVSRWYEETDDDVFVMVDDDISFAPDVILRLIEHCRSNRDIVVAGYPVHNGQFLSSETLEGKPFLTGQKELVELRHAATGCMAVHRRVIEALVPTLPKCHTNYAYPFWPMFMPIIEKADNGEYLYLSEDWAFTSRAREAGFHAWIDPALLVNHGSRIELNLSNMYKVFEAAST